MYYTCCRLIDDGVCSEATVPSISSINRIIRDKSLVERRGYDVSNGSINDEVNRLKANYIVFRRIVVCSVWAHDDIMHSMMGGRSA